MENIKNQIETLLYENAPDFEISKLLKKEIKTYFGTLEESFAKDGGKGFLLKHTCKIDSIIKLVYKVAMRSMFGTYMPMKSTLPITLLALGSYGREQLCVHSDIDLMIVYKEVSGYNTKEMIEKILYILWDAGLKLGHRVHEVGEIFEVSQTDITIKTSMIESRFIEGSVQLWNQTENELHRIRHDNQEEFIRLKIEEMHTLHQRYPLTMEPNLKEGAGGFRNANLVYWIGNILNNVSQIKELDSTIIQEKEYKEFWKALEFLFTVRSALHLATGKKEDQLRLELIPMVSSYLSYKNDQKSHTKFSRRVISSLKTVRLYTTIWIDSLTNYYDEGSMLTPQGEEPSYYDLLLQLCQASKEQFPVHPKFLQALTQCEKSPQIKEDVYTILLQLFSRSHVHLILNTLVDAKLLGYTIPYMKKVMNLPQFDGYHQYSVGIHTVKAIEALENISDTRIASLYNQLSPQQQSFIKVVTLLHDAGKGRKKDHHMVGTVIFKGFAKRLNFSKEEIMLGKKLILNHTLMNKIAHQEDLHSEKVILKFSSHFPTQLELNFIYILTYADMSGVGGNLYSNFSSNLLYTLYQQSSLALGNIKLLDETSKRMRKERKLMRTKEFKTFTRPQQKRILSISSDLFFIKNSPEEILAIATKAHTLQEYDYIISNQNFLTIEIFRRKNLDLSYLLYKLSRLDIVQMDIYKLFSGIKYFKIEFNETISEGDEQSLHEIIIEALNKEHKLELSRPFIDETKLDIDCDHSKEHAKIQLKCDNKKGLLSYLIQLFDSLNVDITSAKIYTKNNRVNDLFLIEKNGNFCHNTNHIIKALTEY